MSLSAAISLPQSPFPPLALGFFGLGTGYLIHGPQELLGFPKRDASVDFGTARALGFFHLGTGIWLMYLMFDTVLNFVFKYTLPL